MSHLKVPPERSLKVFHVQSSMESPKEVRVWLSGTQPRRWGRREGGLSSQIYPPVR